MNSYPKLFIPGPTHVPKSVMEALATPQIGHRTEEISNLIEYIIKGIQKVLYTKNNIYLISHAATGLWEMGLRNSVDKGVLHCDNGAFSSKWGKVSQACGYKNKIIEYISIRLLPSRNDTAIEPKITPINNDKKINFKKSKLTEPLL